MTITIDDLKLPPDYSEADIRVAVMKRLRVKELPVFHWKFERRSLDARKKQELHYLCRLAIDLPWRKSFAGIRGLSRSQDEAREEKRQSPVVLSRLTPTENTRPVICGAGPAGLFAAWELALAGLCPLILERGEAVSDRIRSVDRMMHEGILDSESNIQFGEGGAGTFSDGKLLSRSKNPLVGEVLQRFAECGAPELITWDAKPHIGTDLLREIIPEMRRRIEVMGGEFKFSCRLEGLEFENRGGAVELRQVRTTAGPIPCRYLVLAPGHSARDLFTTLYNVGLRMENKPFAVGFRIEHPQTLINRVQYGREQLFGHLGAADYQLAVQTKGGRGVYTFCMCPGGEVVAAASEQEHLVVNGMSLNARAGENANSAVLCTVDSKDFGDGVLDGMHFQRKIEREAFILGGGRFHAPIERVDDYLRRNPNPEEPEGLIPSYRPGVRTNRLDLLYPEVIDLSLREGLLEMGQRLPGFDLGQAVLTAAETRSSSPVRLCRDSQTLMSLSHRGVFPAGEGAGYAGGITSSAVDGIRVARALIDYISQEA